MKQLIQMFFFDVKMNTKSFMGAYMLIVPMVLLLVLQGFLPTVQSASITFAIVIEGPYAVEDKITQALDEFGDIKRYGTIEEMERELRGAGFAEGLYRDPENGQYVAVTERSLFEETIFSYSARYIRQIYYRENYPDAPRVTEFSYSVPPELSDRTKTSPIATMGGSAFLSFLIIICSFIIGIGVVNDKEFGTDMALRVTPVSKADYFIGKSILPLLITFFYTLMSLLILGLIHVNILQVYLVMLFSFPVTLLFGLIIGAIGKNETEAIGVGKILGVVVMLGIAGGIMLPDNWKWVVWWAPFYWIFDILKAVFTETATWIGLAWKLAVVVGLAGIYFILLRKKIIKGLS